MCKKLLSVISFFACCLFSLLAQAQPYCNEWINFNQTYYKIKAAKSGLYRIPYTALQNTGLPLTATGYQLFCNGQEIPIYTSTNGEMNEGDYLLFLAQPNDATLDAQLYKNPQWLVNPFRSLFTDTTAYFLTWNNNQPNRRFTLQNNDISSAPPPEPYFEHKARKILWNQFIAGYTPINPGVHAHTSFFEEGEGFTGTMLSSPNNITYTIATPYCYRNNDAPNAFFETVLTGRSNDFYYYPDHPFTITIGGDVYAYNNFEGYHTKQLTTPVFIASLGQDNTNVLFNANNTTDAFNNIAISWFQLTYPRQFNFGNEAYFEFALQDMEQRYVEISNFNGGNNPLMFDLTNEWLLNPFYEDSLYKVILPQATPTATARKLVLVNTNAFCPLPCVLPNCTVANCPAFEVAALQQVSFTNFSLPQNQGNYLIITHPSLMQGDTNRIQQYADYRTSATGGGYTVKIINIEELYDQFAWGIDKQPLSIRHFTNFAIDHWELLPQYMFLIGKGISYESIRNYPPAYQHCLIPTHGHHPSDNLLVARNAENWMPQLPIGRLSAQTPQDVRQYLLKVQHHEAPKPCTWEARNWTKTVLQAASAHSPNETDIMTQILNHHANMLDSSLYNLLPPETYSQYGFTTLPQPNFNNTFNEGVILLNYIGEGQNVQGINFDIKNPEEYQNLLKNPFMLINTSWIGDNYSYGSASKSMSEKFVMADTVGAIGCLAGTSFECYTFVNALYKRFLHHLFIENPGMPVGYNLHRAIADKYIAQPQTNNEWLMTFAVLAQALECDPALKIAAAYSNAEFTFETPAAPYGIAAVNPQTEQVLTGSPILANIDSVFLQLTVSNLGWGYSGQLPVQILLSYANGQTYQYEQILNFNSNNLTQALTLPTPIYLSDTVTVTCNLNPFSQIPEDCSDNNTASLMLIHACNVSLSATAINALCYGMANGAINLAITGVQSPVSILWSDGAATEDRTGLAAGTYSVTVTDEGNCTAAASATVAEPAVLGIMGTVSNVTITNGSDGSINVTVTGGTAPYTYLWSDGATTKDRTGLSSGTYTATVTDANGCSEEVNFAINEPNCNLSLSSSATDALCNGDDSGSIDLTITGVQGAVSVLWNDGATTEDRIGLAAGTYSVTVTDEGNCTSFTQTIISEPAQLSFISSIGHASIDFLGGIDITVTGGTPLYTYIWSNGETTQDIINLTYGIYTLTVTDANGCSLTSSFDVLLIGLQAAENSKVKIYPNPITNRLFISGIATQQSHAYLYNTLGQLAHEQALIPFTINELPMHSLPPGIYRLLVQTGSNSIGQSIIKW